MKKFFTAAIFVFVIASAHSQQLSQVSFSNASNLAYFSFLVDQSVLVRFNPDGKITEWGIELLSNRGNYYDPKLQPYNGRLEYYGPESDSAFRGKVKSIGTSNITYYNHFEAPEKIGKVRSIGTLQLDYYTNFDDVAFRGKLRFIGSSEITYYSSLDDEAYRGKVKSIGNTSITYCSSFEDKMIKGKVKTIGSVNFDWYTSFDRTGLGGSLKSGLYRQNIGSITYILR